MSSHTGARAGDGYLSTAFVQYALLTGLAGCAAFWWMGLASEWGHAASEARFWLLAAFVVIGELLPIKVPRRHSHDKVTISTAFAVALLLLYGPLPAAAVYGVASAITDVVERGGLVKLVFNVAQYALSLAAAAAVMGAAGDFPPVSSVSHSLPAILLSALAFFVANHVLAGVGAALLTGSKVTTYLHRDLLFQAWTAGFLLTLGPIVLAVTDTSLALLPLSFCPMLAIYFGGRQAAINAHGASHDSLTDLPNRSLFHERVGEALRAARRERDLTAVMIMDLDDFKAVNDTLGHHFGDVLLKHIGPRVMGVLGEDDVLARLGGDEFAVLLTGIATPEEAGETAERIIDALEDSFQIDGLSIDVRTSIGGACYPDHGDSSEELLRHADVALYCAKQSRTGHELYESEQDQHSLDRLALAGQLRRGIARGELVLHYQPKVSLGDGDDAPEVEALVRWQHPQLGLIGPEGFIPLAEQTGLINPLTAWVLEDAVRQCAEWRDGALELRVSVNLSSYSLLDRELPGRVADLLARHEVPASSLEVEITESKIVADFRRARTMLEELRDLGVGIAIDDFGTGFSSLVQLQQLPVDEIKIDRSFVTSMESSDDDATIVRSTIDLGRNLALKVTAEGVETEGVWQRLHDLGCHFAQGYYIGRPLPAHECLRLLRKRAKGHDGAPEAFAVAAAANGNGAGALT